MVVSVIFACMIQLFLHLLGDYFLQNDWLALNKGKFSRLGWLTCSIHCLLYSIPFGIYYHSLPVFLIVLFTHFLIDKFGLAEYITRTINWNWDRSNLLGFQSDRPPFISVWLHIIRDNSLHLFCNWIAITYFLTF